MAATVRETKRQHVLVDHEVFLSRDPGAVIGRNGLFGPEWHSVGIEPEDSKVERTRNLDKDEVKANGFGTIATTYKPGDVTGKVTVLEDNEIIDYVAWPDSITTPEGVRLRRHTSKVAKVVWAMVEKRENGTALVTVSREPAHAMIQDLGRGDKPEGRDMELTFYPDRDRVIFEEYLVKEDGTVEPINLNARRFVDPGEVQENDPRTFKWNLEGATGGDWSVQLGSVYIAGLAHDATADDIQAAARAGGDDDVTVTGDAATGFTVKNADGPVVVEGRLLSGGEFPKAVEVTAEDPS